MQNTAVKESKTENLNLYNVRVTPTYKNRFAEMYAEWAKEIEALGGTPSETKFAVRLIEKALK